MTPSQHTFLNSQSKMPLVEALRTSIAQKNVAFHAPGHKKGQGIPQSLERLLGRTVFTADLPELPELDNLFAPSGVIQKAQKLAAEAFGAENTWFLVNGSTCGIVAAILATCNPGDKIVLPRNIHQSVIAGLILSGAIPIFLNPYYDPLWDLSCSITPNSLKQVLEENSDVKAVMIVYPTYHGICADIKVIADLTHRQGIPLLVDEAHGGHFTFHQDLPPCALSMGADLTVQSTHKVLGAMTQASMLHLQGTRIDPQRISRALQLIESTSPSYLLLASLDAARQQMALHGKELLDKTLEFSEKARQQLSQIQGLSILDLQEPFGGFYYLDTTRLTVNITALGLSGFEVDKIFHQQLGITAELPMLRHLTFIISIGNTTDDVTKLIAAFQILSNSYFSPHSPISPFPHLPIPPSPHSPISPRETFFAATEMIDFDCSIGRISGDLIYSYPPGIPILMPGEKITDQTLEYLQTMLALGASVINCSDSSLQKLKVLA
ncbi:aminotransferase class I/II-fold pyridoxal phosphate-dependent enzyme [cyanobacterium endosymbiont of Rhopalodia gibberula]|uniref:aminotransferase class I/II-fold pyridoxal phosphate-dependent enzyme n=1 Tax=cyanobacterium endosymbiont of Rhopalodia gibberula TaxID=1763363 RepID=UPI000E656D6D|nr:aminotransferase class I/II-fold pyridoxal phosphate-dependent enzyme [cyanobacterium endosymbiont of Rhopalodia gibberula]